MSRSHTVLLVVGSIFAGITAGSIVMMATFFAVAGGGQALDPTSPGDQWIFVGGVASFVTGPVVGLGTTVAVALAGAARWRSQPAD